MTTAKRNCLWCFHSNQYDEDLFHCDVKNRLVGRKAAQAHRKCADYREAWCRADDFGCLSDAAVREREHALYRRRMAGDWS